MKRLTIGVLLVAALALPAAALAQGQGRGIGQGGPPGQQGLSLTQLPPPLATKLKLTDEQKTKLQAIGMGMQQQLRDAFQNAQGGDRQAALQAVQTMRTKAETDAAAILTADQKKTFDAWKAEAAQYVGLGRSAVVLLAVDGITDAQKTQLKALSTTTQTKRQELFQSLQGGGGGGGFQQLQTLQTETDAAVKKILTADQVKQFDAAVAAMPAGGPFGRRPGGAGGQRPPR